MNRRRLASVRWFRRGTYGTVYLLHSLNEPALFKVGYTTRKTKDRRAELTRVRGDDLKIVFTISMPHAYVVEQLVLQRLRRRLFGRGDARGTEWFRLRKHETLTDIANRLQRAALQVRWFARFKLAWRRDCQIRVFDQLRTSSRT